MQGMKDLMQRLIGAWLEWKRALFKMSLTSGAGVSIQPQGDIMNIHYDEN